MRKSEVIETILAVLAREFNCTLEKESINTTQTIAELCGLDSLGFVQFVCAIEKEFGISFGDDISFDALNKFDTLADEIIKLKQPNECAVKDTTF
jgi:acyl carrier protein